IKGDTREKLLGAFQREACSSNMLAFYRKNLGRAEKLRFWIAPVDLDFPVILYTVERSPYVGKVYFGTRSLLPLYSEFNYITDPGSKTHARGLRLIRGIKSEGDQFELRDGRLIPVGELPP